MFTHIINPFVTDALSVHHRAQRITFAGLGLAVEVAAQCGIQVQVLAVVYPEDLVVIESPAQPVPTLARSIRDVCDFEAVRRYPLLADVFAAANPRVEHEYVVFTNMDIVPQPYFYIALRDHLIRGVFRNSSFWIINRRTVEMGNPTNVRTLFLPLGKGHEGWDCFVFPSEWLPNLRLGSVCIGVPFFDNLLGINLDVLSEYRGAICERQMLTAHLGDDKSWQGMHEYISWNHNELRRTASELVGHDKPTWPRGSVAERMYSRATQERDVRPRCTDRVLRRLKLDREASLWKAVSQMRAAHGLPVYRDPMGGPMELIRRVAQNYLSQRSFTQGPMAN